MPHIQLNLDFLTHPKTLATSPLSQLLFIRMLIYAATHLTDGFVPMAALSQLSYDLMQYERLHYVPEHIHAADPQVMTVHELLAELLANKRLKIAKNSSGYWVHDYLDYQLSKRQVIELIDKRRKAGQAGGQASATARAQANRQRFSNDFQPPSPSPSHVPNQEEKEVKSKRIVQSVDNSDRQTSGKELTPIGDTVRALADQFGHKF